MRFEEALKAMRDGKKVFVSNVFVNDKIKVWLKDGIVRLGESEEYSREIYDLRISAILSEDWEVVENVKYD